MPHALTRLTGLLALAALTLPTDISAQGTVAPVSLNPGSEFRDCADCPAMVVIPPGQFDMGFDGGEEGRYEGPVRRITINYAYAVGKYEVSNAEYRRFINDTGHISARDCNLLRDGTYRAEPGTNWQDPGYQRPIRENEPVVCISWNDAKAFVAWLARRTGQPYRLLTEAEWEYVGRGNRGGHRFVWGERPAEACRESNVFDQSAKRARPDRRIDAAPCDDGFAEVAPVGSLAANPFGVHDILGNVWEWVEDCYVMPLPPSAPRDGSAQLAEGCDRRGSRGGSWLSTFSRQTPTFRGRDPATLVSQIFGLRVARDLSASRQTADTTPRAPAPASK